MKEPLMPFNRFLLKELRIKKKLSVYQLAQKVDMEPTIIYRLESGKYVWEKKKGKNTALGKDIKPAFDTVEKIAAFFEMPIDAFRIV